MAELNTVENLLAEELPDEAIKIVNKYLKGNPNNARGYVLRGKAYSQMGESNKAINVTDSFSHFHSEIGFCTIFTTQRQRLRSLPKQRIRLH
jgi:regulator of sirC expression with transglutaminase-like and TPR domain